MSYHSALDLDIQIHTAEALHASGQAHDAYMCGQCDTRRARTGGPREWRTMLAPMMSEPMRPRGQTVRYLGRGRRA